MPRMHRMATLSILLAALSHNAKSSAQEPGLPRADLSFEQGETLESINALPWIVGDRESQRREWIKKAFDLKADKSKTPALKNTQIYEFLDAADHHRSSTFTRCNLGMLAHERGDVLHAAEYFQRELRTPLPPNASEQTKLIRHVCETYASLAFVRVGALRVLAPDESKVWVDTRFAGDAPLLGAVFVKPNQDVEVRVQLNDEGELREKVSVGAGETTTLEFQSKKKPQTPNAPKAGLPFVPRGEKASGNWAPMSKAEPSAAKTALFWTSVGVGAIGAVLGVVGMAVEISANARLDTAVAKDGTPCRATFNTFDDNICGPLNSSVQTANLLQYIGLGQVALGGVGLLIYGLYPEPARANMGAYNPLPKGLVIQGTWY